MCTLNPSQQGASPLINVPLAVIIAWNVFECGNSPPCKRCSASVLMFYVNDSSLTTSLWPLDILTGVLAWQLIQQSSGPHALRWGKNVWLSSWLLAGIFVIVVPFEWIWFSVVAWIYLVTFFFSTVLTSFAQECKTSLHDPLESSRLCQQSETSFCVSVLSQFMVD